MPLLSPTDMNNTAGKKQVKIIDRINRKSPFYSVEFFPPRDRENWPDFFKVVDSLSAINPLFASVTYGAGGGTRDNTLDITATLAEKGHIPMAHLTCVGATREYIREYLNCLAEKGVSNILALRGDPPAGQNIRWEDGEFVHASDLVEFVHREFPDFGIAVAAYPTPHPQSASFADDRRYTQKKLDAGADFAITQLFFDYREYFEFSAQLRAIGMTKPVIPGVLPILSLESIRRVLSLSGCNIPAKLYLSIEEANQKGGVEAVKEAGIAFAVDQIKKLLDNGAPGIHLYTLNKAETCLRIVEAVGRL